MFLVGLISWWYGRSWTAQWRRAVARVAVTVEFFSIGQLVQTLFAPFRQIAAVGGGDGTVGSAVRALVDKTISRGIGAVVRTGTIIVGVVVMTVQAIYELLIVIAWWLVPFLPVAGAIMLAIGWVPSWQ